jgi:hypothetical protein
MKALSLDYFSALATMFSTALQEHVVAAARNRPPATVRQVLGHTGRRSGWTNARYKRHAMKLRNKSRNRSAHK